MDKTFLKFVSAWKELSDSGKTDINEATLTFFIAKHFGISKNNFCHYKSLSLSLGFISANKNRTYSINKEVIDSAFDSRGN